MNLQLAKDKLEYLVKNSPVRSDGGTGGDNARYGVVTTKGEVKYQAYPCHAYMKRFSNPEIVYSQFVHHPKISRNLERRYFDWITGPESPWRELHQSSSYYGGNEYAYEYGFIWEDLTKNPSNLQHNFLVATRMPKEWKEFIERWGDWVNQGIHPSLAFFFITVFSKTAALKGSIGIIDSSKSHSDVRILSQMNTYDWPVDVVTSGEDYLLNFIHGKVESLNKPYSEDQGYTPVNRIFGVNTLPVGDKGTYLYQLFDRYHDKYGPDEGKCAKAWEGGTGLSKFCYRSHWYLSEKEILLLVKDEQNRLKL